MKLGLVITFHSQGEKIVMQNIRESNKLKSLFDDNIEIVFSCNDKENFLEIKKLITKNSLHKIKLVDSSGDGKESTDLLFNFLNGSKKFSKDVKFVYKKDPDDYFLEEGIGYLISNINLLKDIDINIIPYKTSQFFPLRLVFIKFIPWQSSGLLFSKTFLDSVNVGSKHIMQQRYEDLFLFLIARQKEKTKIRHLQYYNWNSSTYTKKITAAEEFAYYSKMIDYILENNLEITQKLSKPSKFWYLTYSFFHKIKKHPKWYIIF